VELTVGMFAELVKSLRAQGADGSGKGQPPRVGLRLRASVVRPRDAGKPISVWVRDVSAVGVGILCPEPFQTGDTLRLLLAGDGPASVGCHGDRLPPSRGGPVRDRGRIRSQPTGLRGA
jgi:hypothetical protein